MSRTPEEPMPVEETYRDLLRTAVDQAGGQHAVAKLIGVDQSTISRAMQRGNRAKFSVLIKLSRALPSVPSPFVAVRDAKHEQWCRVGAALQERRPALFDHFLALASEALEPERAPLSASDASIDRLKSVISDPVVRRRRPPTER